jgi:thiol-disulfide isomerase/thioredoxin
MVKRVVSVVAASLVLLVGIGAGLYLANGAPAVAAMAAADARAGGKPLVVKVHARWCPKCLMTMDVWSEIENTYAGRVNLLVLDFTNEQTTEASEAEVRRLGLEGLLDSLDGTGSIAVVDAATRRVSASISGSRDVAEYKRAIDEALASSRS